MIDIVRIMHSSDWHLGKKLCGHERRKEFEAFLDWLVLEMERQSVCCLIVAGDVFDSVAPPHWVLALYYRFLARARQVGCRHVVVTGGNHDSAALLDGPAQLLDELGVQVRGGAMDGRSDVVELRDENGRLEAVVCAVPFLREGDLRVSLAGEDDESRRKAMLEGLQAHYRKTVERARSLPDWNSRIPLIATGHLYVTGARRSDDDGMRDLMVGTLDMVPLDVIFHDVNYLALGHIHRAQQVGHRRARYSGSPLCLGFGDADQKKSVTIIDFEDDTIELVDVPVFRRLTTLQGNQQELMNQLENLKQEGQNCWIELVLTENAFTDLWEQIKDLASGSSLDVVRVRQVVPNHIVSLESEGLSAADWSPQSVFRQLLEQKDISGSEAQELEDLFKEVLAYQVEF